MTAPAPFVLRNSQILSAAMQGPPGIVSPLTADLNANDFNILNVEVLTFAGVVANGNSGSSATINWSMGATQSIVLTANCTLTFLPPPGACSNLMLFIFQNTPGGWGITWPNSPLVQWTNKIAP